MADRTCATCGAKFTPSSGTAKFCSEDCRPLKLRRFDRKCGECGSSYFGRRKATCDRCYYFNHGPKERRDAAYVPKVRSCPTCGEPFNPAGSQKWCTAKCRPAKTRIPSVYTGTCGWCGSAWTATGGRALHRRFCSRSCAGIARSLQIKDRSAVPWVECDQCGQWFTSRIGAKRCSTVCRKLHTRKAALADYYKRKAEQGDGRTPRSNRAAVDRRSKRLAAVWVEDVTIDYLIKRDGSRCHLCKLMIVDQYRWPDIRTPSIDHLVPLSLGGEHSKANTALAHLGCNLSKHTRPAGEQLRLVG